MVILKGVVSLLLLFFNCFTQQADSAAITFTGKVIKIIDGDTYDILLNNRTTKRIRMAGIDAPERGMPYYKRSKDYLGSLCFGKVVKVVQTGKDRNGRIIAESFLANEAELGQQMIVAGFAWHFKKYSSSPQLANAEVQARIKRAGLWADEHPIAPWEWRKRPRTAK